MTRKFILTYKDDNGVIVSRLLTKNSYSKPVEEDDYGPGINTTLGDENRIMVFEVTGVSEDVLESNLVIAVEDLCGAKTLAEFMSRIESQSYFLEKIFNSIIKQLPYKKTTEAIVH